MFVSGTTRVGSQGNCQGFVATVSDTETMSRRTRVESKEEMTNQKRRSHQRKARPDCVCAVAAKAVRLRLL